MNKQIYIYSLSYLPFIHTRFDSYLYNPVYLIFKSWRSPSRAHSCVYLVHVRAAFLPIVGQLWWLCFDNDVLSVFPVLLVYFRRYWLSSFFLFFWLFLSLLLSEGNEGCHGQWAALVVVVCLVGWAVGRWLVVDVVVVLLSLLLLCCRFRRCSSSPSSCSCSCSCSCCHEASMPGFVGLCVCCNRTRFPNKKPPHVWCLLFRSCSSHFVSQREQGSPRKLLELFAAIYIYLQVFCSPRRITYVFPEA